MMIIFLYVLILLPLSLFLIIHKSFNKHIHLFSSDLVTTFQTIDNYNLHTDSSSITLHVLDSPPSTKIGEGIEGLMVTCTENLGFKTMDSTDEIVNNNDNEDNDNDDCWTKIRVAEKRGNFPPPLSSLNENGKRSFILIPMRKNGRLQLSKVKIKRPKILHAIRQDGRLRLFYDPDQCVTDNKKQEKEEGEEEKELVNESNTVEEQMEREELILESREEEELTMEPMEKEEVVKEVPSYEQTKDMEWKFPNERFRKCHQVVNQLQYHHHVHGSLQNLHMYGVGIA